MNNVKTRSLVAFLNSVTTKDNIEIIRAECKEREGAVRTSPSLQKAIIAVYPDVSGRTAWTCLKQLLKTHMKPEALRMEPPTNVSIRRIMNILKPVAVIIKELYKRNPLSERQVMSEVRHQVIKKNFGIGVMNLVKAHGGFCQCPTRKEECEQRQHKTRKAKVMNQTQIDIGEALRIGSELVRTSSHIMAHETESDDLSIREKIMFLIATVMYAIGTRLTEVLIVSEYEKATAENCSKVAIKEGAQLTTINPVAKGRDGEEPKSSTRVILFGLNYAKINVMVKRIRAYLSIEYPTWRQLDKNNRDDRERAMRRVVPRLSCFIDKMFTPLIGSRRATPRDLRAMYVAVSYRQWATRNTSEVMWINQMLDHTDMNTSIAYNSFYLTQMKNTTEQVLRKEIKRLRRLIYTLHKEAKIGDVDNDDDTDDCC